MTAQVTVVIPTLNRPRLLAQALDSVACQRVAPGTVEVIVVNDGGVDVTSPVRAARERGLPVRLINLARRRGLSAARNAGLSEARGTFVAFLDDDDIFLPDHLSVCLAALAEPGVDAAYTTCQVEGRRIDPRTPPCYSPQVSYPFDPDLLAVANFIPVHSAVIRRPPSHARFDPDLPALEDWDMWLRLVREAGYRFVHVPRTTVVYHRISQEQTMCGATVTDCAALAAFGRLTHRTWQRWSASSPAVRHFRLYIALMYWHALAELCSGRSIADLYFLACMDEIAAVWHGRAPEDQLVERIIESIRSRAHAEHQRT